MAKAKYPPINEIAARLKKKQLQPLYYLFGDDTYALQVITGRIADTAGEFVASDFDKETLWGSQTSIEEIIDFAVSFPFGSEKKLLIVREFEKVQNPEKALLNYLETPADFCIVVLVYGGTPKNTATAFYKKLHDAGVLFEARELRDQDLEQWLISLAAEKGKKLTRENAQLLLSLTGENRHLIEMQFNKMLTYLGDTDEITLELITDHVIATRQYSIFNLQDAIMAGNRKKGMEIALRLQEQGESTLYIIGSLNRFFSGLLQIPEMTKNRLSDYEAARYAGTHPFFYKNYKSARRHFSDAGLRRIANALLKVDYQLKSSPTDEKVLLTTLMQQIFSVYN